MFGLSLGGEIAAEACHLEPRLRARLAMDVWMPQNVVQAGLQQPTMWISRDAATMRLEGWAEGGIDRTLNTMRVAFERAPEYGYFILVPGMFHADFSDAPSSPRSPPGWVSPGRSMHVARTASSALTPWPSSTGT